MSVGVEITGCPPEAVMHVASNMREADREEIFATRWTDNPMDLAEDVMLAPGPKWTAWINAEPAVVVGATPMWPGVWSVYAFGTSKFKAVAWPVTEHIRRVIMPGLVVLGAHRAECRSIATHTEAHRWLERLGATRAAELPGYGRNGEDFALYTWTKDSIGVLVRR